MPHAITVLTQWVDRAKEPVYTVAVGSLYAIYVMVYLGAIDVDPAVVADLRTAVTALICAFLLLKFNPFHKSVLKPFDSTIIFGSALILLNNLANANAYSAGLMARLQPGKYFAS